MSIIQAYNEAWEMGDAEKLEAIIHDDCVFNPHVGGMTMSKSDIMGFVKNENKPTSENNRILYENEEVGVAHSIVHFANDSDSEAVMSFMRFKDGQIISMETGATPLSPDYKLIGNN
jgi:ketosteroid isomerase-like protein